MAFEVFVFQQKIIVAQQIKIAYNFFKIKKDKFYFECNACNHSTNSERLELFKQELTFFLLVIAMKSTFLIMRVQAQQHKHHTSLWNEMWTDVNVFYITPRTQYTILAEQHFFNKGSNTENVAKYVKQILKSTNSIENLFLSLQVTIQWQLEHVRIKIIIILQSKYNVV